MSTITSIEWSDRTWGVVLGCDKVSPGCTNCYAIRTAHRLKSNPNAKIKAAYADLTVATPAGKLNWSGLVRCLPERLQDPLHWKKPQRIFVNSQSDLFHEDVPFEFIDQVFAVMSLCRRHTFQILTKRPARMLEYFDSPTRGYEVNVWALANALRRNADVDPEDYRKSTWPLPNVWIGVSVENQETADARIPLLLAVPAAVRFLSCEPLLGPVDLTRIAETQFSAGTDCLSGKRHTLYSGDRPAGKIDWVIVGGESGPNARPMHPAWARSLRDQCVAAGVPFFFKQWGEFLPLGQGGLRLGSCSGHPHFRQTATFADGSVVPCTHLHESGEAFSRVGKKRAGRLLDGREWNEMPQITQGLTL